MASERAWNAAVRWIVGILLGCLVTSFPVAAQDDLDPSPFTPPPGLQPAIEFWQRIYTRVSTRQGLIHDRHDLNVVYHIVQFTDGEGPRARRQRLERLMQKYQRILLRLAKGPHRRLTPEERRVLSLWPANVSRARLRKAADNLRFQKGQAERFRAGLVRAGAWEDYIRQTLQELGLPQELAALPHVESSFDPHAYSKVGAAGLWQFMPATGRRYMRVDRIVDERLDPYVATVAAARLLARNYQLTGSWPLAITAYNHGVAGINRIVKALGTQDISQIARTYEGGRFGFASRNFYAAFLAALAISRQPEQYFGELQRDTAQDDEIVYMNAYISAGVLSEALGVELAVLKRSNPALRSPVWRETKLIPRGYRLRIPRDTARDTAQAIAAIPRQLRYAQQRPDRYHRVSAGQSLSVIAARYNVDMHELARLNALRDHHYLRVGQRLRLPLPATRAQLQPVQALPRDGHHQVQEGETLRAIANRYGLDLARLRETNGLAHHERLRIGQRLHLASALVPRVYRQHDTPPDGPLATHTLLGQLLAELDSASRQPPSQRSVRR